MPGPEPVPALVLGGGVTALGVVRALALAGVPAVVAAAPGDAARRSRWARPVPAGLEVPPEGGLASWLEGTGLERAVLLPCADAVALEVAELGDGLRTRFRVSTATPDVLRCLVDKAAFARRLDALGVAAPATWVLDGPDALEQLPDDAFADAFLKPRDSQRFFREHRVKAFHVHGRDDARRKLATALAGGHGMVLQHYVPGGPDRHWFLDAAVGPGGRLLGLAVRHRLRMYPADFGNSSYMVTAPAAEVQPAVAALEALLAALDYRGMASAEFKQDTDGTFRLLEVNARAWWYVGFSARSGMNAPHLAWRDALGFPPGPRLDARPGRRCMYGEYDRHAPGRPAFPAWLLQAAVADHPVSWWRDPAPGWHGTWDRLRRRASRSGSPARA